MLEALSISSCMEYQQQQSQLVDTTERLIVRTGFRSTRRLTDSDGDDAMGAGAGASASGAGAGVGAGAGGEWTTPDGQRIPSYVATPARNMLLSGAWGMAPASRRASIDESDDDENTGAGGYPVRIAGTTCYRVEELPAQGSGVGVGEAGFWDSCFHQGDDEDDDEFLPNGSGEGMELEEEEQAVA